MHIKEFHTDVPDQDNDFQKKYLKASYMTLKPETLNL